MNVAVIPARGGSKRIPRKNIRNFCGKPIIAWPIELIKASGLFDHIIISTDDEEIAEISLKYSVEVPFIRPENISGDHTCTVDVISHAISWMYENQIKPETVCCVYATSVFLTSKDLHKGFNAMATGNWSYAISITDFESPIFRSFKEHHNGGLEMYFPDYFEKRSQDLPVAFYDAAQFYLGKPEAWLDNKIFFDRHTFPVKIPRWRIQDIDNEDDWRRAELLFDILKNK